MRTVWKFPIEVADRITIEMPANSRILHVADGFLWALVNPASPRVPVHFRIFGTGHAVPESFIGDDYVGTWLDFGKLGIGPPFVWHLFRDVERDA